jgi:stalled ribosome rescue protein Dom34
MNLPLLISMPFAYLLAEMVINYFFNRKIEMIGKKEFNKAATLGAISTFLFLSSVFLGTLIAEMGGLDGY